MLNSTTSGFTSCPGAKKVMDSFFSDKPEKVVCLSIGQGLVMKGYQ